MSDIVEIKYKRKAPEMLAGTDVLDSVKARMLEGDLKGAYATLVIWINADDGIDYAMSESMSTFDALGMVTTVQVALAPTFLAEAAEESE